MAVIFNGLSPADFRQQKAYWASHQNDNFDEGAACRDLMSAVEFIETRFKEASLDRSLIQDHADSATMLDLYAQILTPDSWDGDIFDMLNSDSLVGLRGGVLSNDEIMDWAFVAVVAERDQYGLNFEIDPDAEQKSPFAGVSDDDLLEILRTCPEPENQADKDRLTSFRRNTVTSQGQQAVTKIDPAASYDESSADAPDVLEPIAVDEPQADASDIDGMPEAYDEPADASEIPEQPAFDGPPAGIASPNGMAPDAASETIGNEKDKNDFDWHDIDSAALQALRWRKCMQNAPENQGAYRALVDALDFVYNRLQGESLDTSLRPDSANPVSMDDLQCAILTRDDSAFGDGGIQDILNRDVLVAARGYALSEENIMAWAFIGVISERGKYGLSAKTPEGALQRAPFEGVDNAAIYAMLMRSRIIDPDRLIVAVNTGSPAGDEPAFAAESRPERSEHGGQGQIDGEQPAQDEQPEQSEGNDRDQNESGQSGQSGRPELQDQPADEDRHEQSGTSIRNQNGAGQSGQGGSGNRSNPGANTGSDARISEVMPVYGKAFDGVGMKPEEFREQIKYWEAHKDEDTNEGRECADMLAALEFARGRINSTKLGDRLMVDDDTKMTPKRFKGFVMKPRDQDPGKGDIREFLNNDRLVKKRGRKLTDEEIAAWVAEAAIAERDRYHIGEYDEDGPCSGMSDDEVFKLIYDGPVQPGVDVSKPNGQVNNNGANPNGAGGPVVQYGAVSQPGGPIVVNGSAKYNATMSQLQGLNAQNFIDTNTYGQFAVVLTVLDIMERYEKSYMSDSMSEYLTRPGATRADKRLAKKLRQTSYEYGVTVDNLRNTVKIMSKSISDDPIQSSLVLAAGDSAKKHGPLGAIRDKITGAVEDKRSGPVDINTFNIKTAGNTERCSSNVRRGVNDGIQDNVSRGAVSEDDAAEEYVADIDTAPKNKIPVHKRFGQFVAGIGTSISSKLPKFGRGKDDRQTETEAETGHEADRMTPETDPAVDYDENHEPDAGHSESLANQRPGPNDAEKYDAKKRVETVDPAEEYDEDELSDEPAYDPAMDYDEMGDSELPDFPPWPKQVQDPETQVQPDPEQAEAPAPKRKIISGADFAAFVSEKIGLKAKSDEKIVHDASEQADKVQADLIQKSRIDAASDIAESAAKAQPVDPPRRPSDIVKRIMGLNPFKKGGSGKDDKGDTDDFEF